MFGWAHGDGWREERRLAHERAKRIEELLEEAVKLLRQIAAEGQEKFNAPGPATMTRVK
jgi:hypothetical protein